VGFKLCRFGIHVCGNIEKGSTWFVDSFSKYQIGFSLCCAKLDIYYEGRTFLYKVGHLLLKLGHFSQKVGHLLLKLGHFSQKVGHLLLKLGHFSQKVGHLLSIELTHSKTNEKLIIENSIPPEKNYPSIKNFVF
jgi:hypothetical protein